MPDNLTPDRKFLTVPEAAEILRVDPVTIYRAIRDNAFPAVRIRGRYIVPMRAIDALAREALDTRSCVDVVDFDLQPRQDRPR